MSRIIINNKSRIPDSDVLELIGIWNERVLYGPLVCIYGGPRVRVIHTKNKASDTFTITDYEGDKDE